MYKETIITKNGERFTLTFSSDGYCFCPVCGEKSNERDWRPYDKDGYPSYDICSCGFEYGFDDSGEPCDKIWERYRQKWLEGEVAPTFGRQLSNIEKLEQLKNLGIT